LKLLETAFKEKVANEWQERIKVIVPSYGEKLNDNIELTNRTREYSTGHLQLLHQPVGPDGE